MKQLILLVMLCLLVGIASANTALNFQQPADFTAQVTFLTSSPDITVAWTESPTGGNSYLTFGVTSSGANYGFVRNADPPTPMDYAAGTLLTPGRSACYYSDCRDAFVRLYNSGGTVLGTMSAAGAGAGSRVEMKVTGGTASLYADGVFLTNISGLSVNPSYVGFGAGSTNYVGGGSSFIWDDIVFGSSQPLLDTASDKYVYGVPETTSTGQPYYMLMKDFTNPAASGFYFGNGTLINSNHFTSTFSKGNNNSDTINLQGYTTGVNVLSNTTETAYTGTISWDLATFFAANPNYGLYAMHSPGSLKYSDLILYIGNGATITWNKPTYAQGESGAIIAVVTTGAYWNPTTYNYRVDVVDIYGVVDATYPVTTQTSTITHQWKDDQAIGVYYAAIIATPKTSTCPGGGTPVVGGTETCADSIWMNAAITNVDAYLTISGYVFDAETTNVISGANVNITQGLSINNVATATDGNYTITGLSQGGTISINVSKSGYETYLHQFTPLRVGGLQLNFTLMPLSPTYTGVALGGVAREPPYNRTINNARIDIQNGTYGSYVATTNSVGYYIQNSMYPNIWYNVWGSKAGFMNSTIYQKLVVGV